jgi:plastocyanin
MRDGNASLIQPWLAVGAFTMLLVFAPRSDATTHIIQFGGPIGFEYSPSALEVTVGDTVEWQGSFTSHPLSSTTIPPGVSPWHNGTGTDFKYVVPLPGTYNYRCDIHFASGMVGSFTATLTAVDDKQTLERPASFRLDQNFPNPFNPSTTIEFALPRASRVLLTVHNMLGQEVATVVDEEKPAGTHQILYKPEDLASGIYFYRLQVEDFVQTKTLVLLR